MPLLDEIKTELKDASFLIASGISVFMLLVAILFLIRLSALISLIRFPLDPDIFSLECTCFAVVIHLLIFGLSTWLFTSNFHYTRFEIRIFMAVVLLIYWIIIFIKTSQTSGKYSAEMVFLFGPDIWDDFTTTGFGPGFVMWILLFCPLALIAQVVWNIVRPPSDPEVRRPKVDYEETPKRRGRLLFE